MKSGRAHIGARRTAAAALVALLFVAVSIGAGVEAYRKDPHRENALELRSDRARHCSHNGLTGDGAYLLSLAEGVERVDLDGRPAGTVTAEEAGQAKTRHDEIARARCASKHRAKPDKQPSATISATRGKQTGKASKANEDGDKTAARLGAKGMSLAELRAAGAERRRGKSRE
jgi:sRNA-binding protein